MSEIQKQFRGWRSKTLKGRSVAVSTDGEMVRVSLGRRLTPEMMGKSRCVDPVPRRLSDNHRMILSDIVLSPEAAIELHGVLDKTLKGAGLIEDNIYEEMSATWLGRLFSKFVMITMAQVYYAHQHWIITAEKKIKAPA